MKQVLHMEAEKEIHKENITMFMDLLDKVEMSEHWFDYKSVIKRINSRRAKQGALLDDFETLSILQARITGTSLDELSVSNEEENPASSLGDSIVSDDFDI
jgi:hypothetical protein